MDQLSYKTISANKDTADKKWVVVDADSAVLGRFASQVASIIRGKHKTNYTPNADCGDYVIILNAEKVRLTGKKMTDRVHVRHTGHPGGQRFATPREILAKFPTRLLEQAIKGMLPNNRLGRRLFHNMFVYAGTEHPHEAQQPTPITLKY